MRFVKGVVLPHVIPRASGMLVAGSLAREHALHYGARGDRVIVFPNTPDVPRFVTEADRLRPERSAIRSRLGIDENEVVVLQVGRLVSLKGLDVLVSAVGLAQRELPEPIRVVLAGEGPEQGALEALAAEKGVRLTMVGQVDGAELISHYVAADIFALLSLRETWGVVVNEAMASGLPLVLSSAVGAARDLLEPGRNGFLVEPRDPGGTAVAIAALASDALAREAFGVRSRAIVEDWGFPRSLDDFCGLAETIVRERAESRRI